MELKKYLNISFRLGLLNLALVALYGALMRYKIAFDFPFFDQKNLLHAHSHFAFSGWVGHILYVGLFAVLSKHMDPSRHKFYKRLININLIAAFGMLLAFTVQGYKVVSISFSTLTIIISVCFCVQFFKDARMLKSKLAAVPWAKMGLLLNVLSAIGPLCLAYMMMSKNINSDVYLGAVYFFLHFQYSGWFFFGTMALAVHLLPPHFFSFKKYFVVFAITVLPTYVLSILWAKPPTWLYILTVAATLVQLAAWLHFIKSFYRKIKMEQKTFTLAAFLFYAAAIALTLKFILQAVSVIPSLSQLVFGFRPIVIAYLHLVLLSVYTLFLLAFMLSKKAIVLSPMARLGIIVFFSGVLLNEAFLGIQGLASFTYTLVPFVNELLLAAALILFTGSSTLLISQMR